MTYDRERMVRVGNFPDKIYRCTSSGKNSTPDRHKKTVSTTNARVGGVKARVDDPSRRVKCDFKDAQRAGRP